MSPMFGRQAEGADGAAALQAEIDRAGALPLPELAAELRARAFGPEGPGGPGRPGTIDGPAEASNRLTGPALDFCLLVTQRRHRNDLALAIEGPAATEWMTIAQAFAGPPGPGRPPVPDQASPR